MFHGNVALTTAHAESRALRQSRPQVPHPHADDLSRHGHGRSADFTQRYPPRLVVLGERPSACPACAQIPDRNRHTVDLTCSDRSDRGCIGGERRSARRPGCEVPDLHAMAVGADGHGHAVDVTDSNGPNRACVDGERFLPGHSRSEVPHADGSGKSHLARALGALLGITPVYVDGLYDDPDWTPVASPEGVLGREGAGAGGRRVLVLGHLRRW